MIPRRNKLLRRLPRRPRMSAILRSVVASAGGPDDLRIDQAAAAHLHMINMLSFDDMAARNKIEITAEHILYGYRLPTMEKEKDADRTAGKRLGSRELRLLNYLIGYHDPDRPEHRYFVHSSILKADVTDSAVPALKRMTEKGWVEQDETGGQTSSWAVTPEGYAVWWQRQAA